MLPWIISCTDDSKHFRNKSHASIPQDRVEAGHDLALRYCQSCHMLPDPSLADAKTWTEGILPYMGPKLGIDFYEMKRYPSSKFDKLLDSNVYPAKPLLSTTEWELILDYYSATSPDTLIAETSQTPMQVDSTLFIPVTTNFKYQSATTSFLKVQEGKKITLLSSDVRTHSTYLFDRSLSLVDSVSFAGPIVNMDFMKGAVFACNIGILVPNNGKYGEVIPGTSDADGSLHFSTAPLFKDLRRPVQVTSTDLNGDGKTDYLICEFGFVTGSLTWMESTDRGFTKHILKNEPGAINAYVDDYNKDGSPDIITLFAQGDESIILFTNNGKGSFTQKRLLRFPPAYGSSYFELDDFNHDGFPDILYTCGDNADYSTILKPYHGVYQFINDGNFNFTQKFFYHINGCYKATAADFDKDGDLDIAAISYFADYAHHPEEGFVYFENESDVIFQPRRIPGSTTGRWLTMAAGDVDGDGWKDIVLGNFSIGPVIGKADDGWKDAPPVLILKNRGKK